MAAPADQRGDSMCDSAIGSQQTLSVVHYNWRRVHEALTPDMRHQKTPAMALGLADHIWSIGELLDAALAVAPPGPTETAPDRRR
jgi:hypothetical protein